MAPFFQGLREHATVERQLSDQKFESINIAFEF
jgi:hypothetical protein